MPAKTKTKNKHTKSKTTTRSKMKSVKKTAKKKMAAKNEIPKKEMAKKKAVKTKVRAHKKVAAKRSGKPLLKKSQTLEPVAFSLKRSRTRSGRQSGDLQGLSTMEGADSESVAELIEEGNPFEADVVLGVESAGADEKEVRTREVPEDDVPGEYLDED